MTAKREDGAAGSTQRPDHSEWFGKVSAILADGGSVEFSPEGYSMWPALRPGSDTVYVRAAAEYRPSDIVLAACRSPRLVVLHRIKEIMPGKVILTGDSNLYQTETCLPADIVGKVVALRRNGRDISASAGARVEAFIQRLPAPLRRLAIRMQNLRRNATRRQS